MKTVLVRCQHLTIVALLLNAGVAAVFAQQSPVRITFSGTGGASAFDLKQPNTHTGEQNLAGNGTLGPFTFKLLRASANSPEPSSTCSTTFIPVLAGGGILRFQDGSLLRVTIMPGGGDCIDFVHRVAECTLPMQINGGTGRFQGAYGGLMFTETPLPAVADASNSPVLFGESGHITGTILGLARDDEPRDDRR